MKIKEKISNAYKTKPAAMMFLTVSLPVAIIFGTWLFEYTQCGYNQQTLAWVDIGTPNVENSYKKMYSSCNNVFGQDYTHNFDDLLKFYPNLQTWRDSQ